MRETITVKRHAGGGMENSETQFNSVRYAEADQGGSSVVTMRCP